MDACVYTTIAASLDRWQECHWHLHQMEQNYHEPEPFRFAFNSFVRAVKEVPTILDHDLQRSQGAKSSIKQALEDLRQSELFKVLGQRRNVIVHQGMLNLKSRGSIGTTEGRTVKISFPFFVSPHETSDEAYQRYKQVCRADKFFRGLGPDCDSAPALWRTWMIPQFPDLDLLDVAFEAWQAVGNLLSVTTEALGGQRLDLTMPCRHDPEAVRIRQFSQYEFFLEVDGIDLREEERRYREQKHQHVR